MFRTLTLVALVGCGGLDASEDARFGLDADDLGRSTDTYVVHDVGADFVAGVGARYEHRITVPEGTTELAVTATGPVAAVWMELWLGMDPICSRSPDHDVLACVVTEPVPGDYDVVLGNDDGFWGWELEVALSRDDAPVDAEPVEWGETHLISEHIEEPGFHRFVLTGSADAFRIWAGPAEGAEIAEGEVLMAFGAEIGPDGGPIQLCDRVFRPAVESADCDLPGITPGAYWVWFQVTPDYPLAAGFVVDAASEPIQ